MARIKYPIRKALNPLMDYPGENKYHGFNVTNNIGRVISWHLTQKEAETQRDELLNHLARFTV